ncbi:hypothetical protein P3X46_027223 [Hevea brasiliensis]|uniref:4Fe-4S ferredoxin-type domain-containing protein n=1 Tax=Hevea brasiliensis TaxID=3981 RepID=A0ABQ9KZE6_HEVBR|nr:stigma-specific STIG1-like protein 3 [Hevea brasiliensis]KAJ9153822.1 hypothetical protein P3X46_027223 [Hevea brasiliensis]
MQQLHNVLIAILLLLILSLFLRGYSAVEQNFTAGSSSLSPRLKKVTKNHPLINHHHLHRPTHLHPHPHPHLRPTAGCRSKPWICREGNRRPKAQMRCCRNKCVDVSSNVNHCGLCGVKCPFSWLCCHGFCVDVNISPFNCGKCGSKCPWGIRCDYGMCGYSEPESEPEPLSLPPWRPRPHLRPRS